MLLITQCIWHFQIFTLLLFRMCIFILLVSYRPFSSMSNHLPHTRRPLSWTNKSDQVDHSNFFSEDDVVPASWALSPIRQEQMGNYRKTPWWQHYQCKCSSFCHFLWIFLAPSSLISLSLQILFGHHVFQVLFVWLEVRHFLLPLSYFPQCIHFLCFYQSDLNFRKLFDQSTDFF